MSTDSEHDAFTAGYEAAVKVFEENFYGGPTKDMVLNWFALNRETRDEARD